MSKFKVGDTVAASYAIGTIVEINAQQVVIEVDDRKTPKAKRPVKITVEHARLLGKTLEEVIEEKLKLVEIKD